jgi:hypothetical protein
VQVNSPADLQGVTLSAWVSAASTAGVMFQNGSTAAVNRGLAIIAGFVA